jgi:excisionase family DNA binding protein
MQIPTPEKTQAPDDLRFVSTETLARWWDTSEPTVRRWARENTVPAIKVGSQWRFRVADLRRVVEAK